MLKVFKQVSFLTLNKSSYFFRKKKNNERNTAINVHLLTAASITPMLVAIFHLLFLSIVAM